MDWIGISGIIVTGSTLFLGFCGIIISLWIFHRDNSKEMKEFHGRLCTLEEKYIQMMERYLEKRRINEKI